MKTFSPDVRNTGGRHIVSNIVESHKKKMDLIYHSHAANSQSPDRSSRGSTYRSQSRRERKATAQSIDCYQPETLELSNMLSLYKKRKKSAVMDKHENEMKHMKRRISEIGSLNERKKNKNDPIAHPVLSRMSSLPKEFVEKVMKRKKPKRQRKNLMFKPVCLEQMLMDKIVQNTLYKDKELEKLFNGVRNEYSYMPQSEIEEAISKVKETLEA